MNEDKHQANNGQDGLSDLPCDKDLDDKILEICEKRYNFEFQRLKDLDTKAGNLIGYVGIVTSLLLGIGTFEILKMTPKMSFLVLYFSGIGFFALSITFALIVVKLREYEFRPYPSSMLSYIQEKADGANPADIYRALSHELSLGMTEAFEANHGTNESKADMLLFSWLWFMLGIALLLIFAVSFGIEYYYESIENAEDGTGSMKSSNLTIPSILTTSMDSVSEDTISFEPLAAPHHSQPPGIEISFQWIKENLTVFVIQNSSTVTLQQRVAQDAVEEWSSLLKTHSNNPNQWNAEIYLIDDENMSIYETNPPDITLELVKDPNEDSCLDIMGIAEDFHEDDDPQYAKIHITCGSMEIPSQHIFTTVLHEFAHTLGLGHAYNVQADLMCSVDEANRDTCPSLPGDEARPSNMDVNALLYIYGNDGFGGFNRIELKDPYYEQG